jgi:hypothetical protein
LTFSARTSHGDHRTPGGDPLSSFRQVENIRQGILLTGTPSQISVEVSIQREMSSPVTTFRRGSIPLWRISTCVLLVGLFLYNPFLAASRASGSLTVCHPASYRATVGSSELEQLAQPDSGVAALLPNVADEQVLIPHLAVRHSTPRHFVELEVVATPRAGFSSSLWFRPPPAI